LGSEGTVMASDIIQQLGKTYNDLVEKK
jgi:hypothetical protein